MRDRSGNYDLIYELGRGGMGQVWCAVRRGPEGVVMTCAIKVLHPSLAQTEADRQRFYNEGRIAAQLDHGRIVKVIDTSEVQGAPCLVMEWVDAVNLRDFLEKVGVPLDLEVCLYIVGEILAALEYAHERKVAGADAGVIHYDVTLGNILISSSGEVKLTDFGIARFSEAADGTMSRAMGTPRYMSAEQLSGKACKGSDIYSLGVVLHELLTGARYLDGCDRQQQQTLVLDGFVPELERPNTPPWVDELRRRMLSREVSERPSAAEALRIISRNTPHYHLASERLRDLYRGHVGEQRSGLTGLIDTEDVPGVFRRRSPVPVPEPALAPTPQSTRGVSPATTKTRAPAFDPPITLTEVLPSLADTPSSTAPDVVLPPTIAAHLERGQPSERRWLIAALAVACLLLTAFGGILLGLLMAQRGPTPTDATRIEATSAEPPPSDEPAESEPTEPEPTEPEPTKPEPTMPEPTMPEPPPETEQAQPEPEPEPTPPPAPERKPSEAPRKILVTFVITGVGLAQLEIGSRTVVHDHYASADLRPGRYPIRWRTSHQQPWHDAGTLVVKALAKDHYYEVHLGPDSMRTHERDEGSAK